MPLFIICLLSLLLFPCCQRDTGCEGHCEDEYPGDNLGRANFQDSTFNWLPDPLPEKMTFKSSRGHLAIFTMAKPDTTAGKTNVKTRTIQRSVCCTDIYKDYVMYQQLTINYVPDESLFAIKYHKLKNMAYDYEDTLKPDFNTFPDQLVFIIANSGFTFSKDFPAVHSDTIFFSGLVFSDVYHFRKTSTYTQYVSDLYFSPSKGVVAFRFNDNEEWVRQD
jgi:hypothetical protein